MPLTSAEAIRKRTINNPEIKAYVSELLENLDRQIQEASLSSNRVDFEVPMDLHVAGLKRADVQRIIYYLFAQDIIKAGYTVKAKFKPKTIFHVTWVTDMDDSDAKKIDQFLVKLSKGPEEPVIKKGIKGGKKASKNKKDDIDEFDLDLDDLNEL
jgi:hypothetical protein